MDDQIKMRRLVLGAFAALVLVAALIVLVVSSLNHDHQMKQALGAQQKSFAASPYADPILAVLPYGDIGYDIAPVVKTIDAKQVLVLEISVKFDESDYKLTAGQQAALVSQKEQAALAYIRQKGFDPVKYRVEYTTPLAQ